MKYGFILPSVEVLILNLKILILMIKNSNKTTPNTKTIPLSAESGRGAAPRPLRLLKKAGENFSPLYPIDFFEMLTRRTAILLCAGFCINCKNAEI